MIEKIKKNVIDREINCELKSFDNFLLMLRS